MKPTVGRIVNYHVSGYDHDNIKNNFSKKEDGTWYEKPVLPAVIVRVWSETTVNLKVLTDGPIDVWKTSAMSCDASEPKEGHWSWPVRE